MAEKALVPAIAVQRDGYDTTRHFGAVIGRDRCRIGERLATTVPDEARQHADGVGFDNPLLMIGPAAFRHL